MKKNYRKHDEKNNKINRFLAKSLTTALLYKFKHEYGYDNGMVTAKAIVEDIMNFVESYYCDMSKLKVGEMLWMAAVKGQPHFYGKNSSNTKKKVIRLTIFHEDDLEELKKKRTNYELLRTKRMARWTYEADKQGACLTQDDLSILGCLSNSQVCLTLKEYQEKTNKSLPLRGYIEDIGRGTTHKKEILKLYRQNYLSPEIARITSHSKDAVDRYINDYEIIKKLSNRFKKEDIPMLARKSKTLVEEYLKICKDNSSSNLNSSCVGVI